MAAISTKPQQNQEIRIENPEPKPAIEQPKPEPVVRPEPKPIPKPEPVKVEQPKPVKEEPKEEVVSLFSDDAVASDDNVVYINGTIDGDNYFLPVDLLVDLMVVGKKDIKASMLENWKNLKRLAAHPKLGKFASMLIDGIPRIVTNKAMVIEYNSDNVVEKINLVKNQKDIQNVLRTVFGKKMFAYAISRKDFLDSYKKYSDLSALGNLPKADKVVIDIVGDK